MMLCLGEHCAILSQLLPAFKAHVVWPGTSCSFGFSSAKPGTLGGQRGMKPGKLLAQLLGNTLQPEFITVIFTAVICR